MSTRNDYSAEEWKAIAAAPVVAGLFITLSDASGLVGTAKEAMAVGRAITESAANAASETPDFGRPGRLDDRSGKRMY